MANNDIIRHSDIAEDNLMQPLRSEIALTIKELNNLDSELIKMATDLKKSLGANALSSSEDIKKFSQQVEYSTEVLKQSITVKNNIVKTEAALVVAVSGTTQELVENNLALEQTKKLAKDNAKLTSDQVGAYDKLAITLNRAKKEYKDLFILQKEGSIRAKELKASIDSMEISIRSADAQVHQHQRNVGNYGNSFNGLSNSVNQLTREMPAFANSAQTGFMAISNNLPILADAIGQLREKNAALNAEGKAGVPIWKSVASALFSWQTAMGVGITLLVTYGKEIGNAIKELFTFSNKTKEQIDLQNELNAAYEAGIENLKGLNDYRLREAEDNTKINVLKARMRGASVKEIAEIEKKGREKEYSEAINHQVEMDAVLMNLRSAKTAFEVANIANQEDEGYKEALKKLDENIKNQEGLYSLASKTEDTVRRRNKVATQQAKLDEIEGDKKTAEERKKISADLMKKREEDYLKELELQHQVRISEIELMKDDNRKKIALLRENMIYETNVNEVKLRNFKGLYDLQRNIVKKYYQDVEELIKNKTTAESVDPINQNPDLLKKAQKFLVDKRKKEETEELKAKQSLITKSLQLVKSSLDRENALKMKAIDADINASQRREDSLRQIAAKGAQNSQENLAFELRKQAELQAQKDRLIKKQIQQERALALLKAISSGNLNGSKNVDSIINSLPSFFDGTEDTGSANNPLDENGGRLAILHDNEAVLKKDLNRKRQKSGLSLDKTIDYALNYQALLNPTSFDKMPMANHVNDERLLNATNEVANKIDSLENTIRNRPIKDWDVNKTERLIELKLIEGTKTTNIQRKSGGLVR
jgi:hypothetical protein